MAHRDDALAPGSEKRGGDPSDPADVGVKGRAIDDERVVGELKRHQHPEEHDHEPDDRSGSESLARRLGDTRPRSLSVGRLSHRLSSGRSHSAASTREDPR